jgi:hypothetical protein
MIILTISKYLLSMTMVVHSTFKQVSLTKTIDKNNVKISELSYIIFQYIWTKS